nr:hypothetical protein [Tanacetum cinerariifolium]
MDKIICDLNTTPDLSQRPPQNCPKYGNPVDGHYCQGCDLLRKKFKEDLFTYCIENGIFQDFQDASEPSNDNTNVVNALQEPFIVKQDPGENFSQSPPQINHYCCYGCGDSLEYIFCHQCTYELPQTLSSFDPTCYSEDGNSFTYESKSNNVDDSPNIFDPPSQPPVYSCEFYENDARYGHYCTPQVPFIYLEPCYNQDFNFLKDFPDFQQQYLCCENCEGPHEAYQCQPMNEDYYHEQNSCYDPISFGFDQIQPPQYTVNHPNFNAQNDIFNSQNKLMEQLTSMCDMEDLFTYCIENEIFQDFQDTSEPSNDNTNVVNALQEPFVVKQDPDENSSQSPPQINHHCWYECGDSLEDIFCNQCTCELCGKGAHNGYNCPPKVPIIPDLESFNNQTVDELP